MLKCLFKLVDVGVDGMSVVYDFEKLESADDLKFDRISVAMIDLINFGIEHCCCGLQELLRG